MRFTKAPDRVVNRTVLRELLCPLTLMWGSADFITALEAVNVPCGPVNTIPEILADPQIQHRSMVVSVPQPEALAGAVNSLRTPLIFDGAPTVSPLPAPSLGAHQAEVLADKNWGA